MADVELVIRIPEEEYRWIIKSDETVFANVASKECMLHAIKNGTQLPKRHGRLIDADALAYELKHFGEICLDEAMTIIEADTEEREDSTRALQDGQERE